MQCISFGMVLRQFEKRARLEDIVDSCRRTISLGAKMRSVGVKPVFEQAQDIAITYTIATVIR
eukprot:4772791-Pleurochrysis_carterae.AAC.1